MRSSILSAYADAARSVDIEPYRMLRKVGLPEAGLRQPDVAIPADRLVTLLEASARESDRPDFGLLVGSAFRLPMAGPLGLLMRQQPTVRAALEALARYLRYQDTTMEVRLTERRDVLVAEIDFSSRRFARSAPAADMAVAMYVQTLRGLLGDEWSPELVALTHPKPRDLVPYQALSRRLEFGHDYNAIVVSAEDAALPIPGADPDMARELARYIERGGAPGSRTAVERVSDLIVRLLPEGYCTIEHVAERLGVDRRTVHRWLAAEGKSFSQLVDEIRRDIAVRELRGGDAPLGEVAERLGFSSLSTFSRWFRAAFGVRARDFRQHGED
ncbi:MAG TPA: AraC family transcriptional regulator [Caulobacteraceae bacterium]|nr:AraC family transcriptional regulator [Caulobacteraceae bacterium]